ncbi:MAG: leucine--tRNA ligase [Oscillospiraceae bacterium]|jgi:leucyl-tRNA synthetase|nr:leucine--tRNA ligase [Oscillospiraceae bacterium]
MYDFKKIEKKWQDFWKATQPFKAINNSKKPKFYSLIEFPYPSSQGLHVGHPRSYVALDIISRKRRMQDYNVLFPIGWDAFGLPTENYAIKNNVHPKEITEKSIAKFKNQLQSLGLSFDWSREINTTDPKYFKWTQWIFSRLFENGLAAKEETLINWCTSCKCVLANEEVISGQCERCSGEVIQKQKSQWVLKITKYAQRLIDDLDSLDYPERVKQQQKNWIGKSEGALIKFKISSGQELEIFTTRPETICGISYMVIAPENKILDEISQHITNLEKINKYKQEAAKKNDFQRSQMVKEKTGVEIKGVLAINPFNGKEIPIFTADYVLANYGTGAIMAVPAHDERDWEFAVKYNLPKPMVICPEDSQNIELTKAFTGNGKLINSGFLNGLTIEEAKKKVIEFLILNKAGKSQVNFKLRDWIFARQRYWGEPIPIINCKECGFVLEENLPLLLPEVQNFQPLENGESPISNCSNWVNTKCPKCGREAQRETDTMPQWAGSSWYFLRYLDPNNNDSLADEEALKYWLPVDWYNGGMEHTTLHLLYSRFWHKFLYDIHVVPCSEPYAKRTCHGMILGESNEKMSKSRGNVVNPDDIIQEFGADVMRVYEMFIGDFENAASWNTKSISGCKRFIEKFFNLNNILAKQENIRNEFLILINKAIKKVSEDIENLKFNTAIATLMDLLGQIKATNLITREELKIFIILLNPFAPHVTEEIWQKSGFKKTVAEQSWPYYNEELINSEKNEIVVQINGKIKTKIMADPDIDKSELINLAKNNKLILKELNNKEIIKEICIPKKIINFVVK